ncbi:MAG: S1 RNA-binding domain-containing protein [Deltaproteobacteria bacterium]|nr:S1 RNA-binding domain-containing protein [Deltaproteobacteria bacterium]
MTRMATEQIEPTDAEGEAAAQEPSDAEGEPAAQEPLDAEGETQAEPAAPDEAEQPAGDEPSAAQDAGASASKHRRRRRHKKKPGEDGAAQGPADAADRGDGGEEPEGDDATARGPGGRAERERPPFAVGEEIFGKVIAVSDQAVLVDIAGGKALGLMDRAAIPGAPPKEGEPFIARVQSCSLRGGIALLGAAAPPAAEVRAKLREAHERGMPVEGWVTGVIKGGVEVDFEGLRVFAPASCVDLRQGAELTYLLGQRLPFVVASYGKKGRDIVLSRKQVLEQQAAREREAYVAKLKPDLVCRAVVRSVLPWGAFVALPDYGNIEGVVHMSETSHDRGAKPCDVFAVGEETEVKVLRIDERGKLWLSHKAILQDPWDSAAARYAVGSRHAGKVVRLTDFGAFIQLEPGIDGLCHVSDLSFLPVEHPQDAVKEGEEIQVVVVNLDTRARKLGLHPALRPDEAGEEPQTVALYRPLKAVVKQVRDAGLTVRVRGVTGRLARGFVPVSQTGTARGTDLRKAFPVGTEIEAKVIELDARKGELKLSVRALKEESEKRAYQEYRAQVQREAKFGTFADLLKRR